MGSAVQVSHQHTTWIMAGHPKRHFGCIPFGEEGSAHGDPLLDCLCQRGN